MLKRFLGYLADNLCEDRYNCMMCREEYPSSRYGLCDDCMKKIALNAGTVCIKCGSAVLGGDDTSVVCGNCSGKFRNFEKGLTPLIYKDETQKLVQKYKFGNAAYMGKYLSAFLVDKVKAFGWEFDTVAFVPLSEKRLRDRGYDQSLILAKDLSEALGKPLFDGLVRGEGPTQHDLSLEEREKNAKTLFSVDKERKKELKDKTVLLVDDIMTTGSTCDSVSAVLKKAGAKRVYLSVLAGAEFKVKFEKRENE